jgi:hypothetical protein
VVCRTGYVRFLRVRVIQHILVVSMRAVFGSVLLAVSIITCWFGTADQHHGAFRILLFECNR